MDEVVLELTEVRKTYRGRVEALRGVALQVPRGAIFGLLGPNGAGKSTLVKILTTIIRPTVCKGTLLGQPVGHKPTLRKVGYLPEHARFPSYLTGRQVIGFAAGLSGVDVPKSRIDELLNLVGMQQAAGRAVRTYSKGMVQRIGFAQALVNNPELVFLDEPTDGVDPAGRRGMRDLLLKMREEGRTVFVNSHLLGELELVCDSVVILKEGEIVRQGSLEELRAGSRRTEVVVTEAIPGEMVSKLEEDGLRVSDRTVFIPGRELEPVQPVIDFLRREGLMIESVSPCHQSLEDLFLESVEEEVA